MSDKPLQATLLIVFGEMLFSHQELTKPALERRFNLWLTFYLLFKLRRAVFLSISHGKFEKFIVASTVRVLIILFL